MRVLRNSIASGRCGWLLVFFLFLLAAPVIASAASVSLAWDPNNPPPLEYRIFVRGEGQAYNYSNPAWSGTVTQCTLNSLNEGQTYYLVARAYSDSGQSSDSNEVKFTAPAATVNQAPVAQAGADQAVSAGSRVTLDGTASQDPDGGISTYKWTQTNGQTVSLQGANTSKASFTAPDVASTTTLTFKVTVADQEGLTAADTCKVTVVPAASSGGSGSGSTDGSETGGTAGTIVVVDDADAAFSTVGTWRVSASAAGYYGTDYAYAYAGNGTAKAIFTFDIPADGDYAIAAQWPAHSSRAPDAPFTLVNNGVVVDTIFANQQIDGGQFNPLIGPVSSSDGTYALAAGVLEVVLTNDASGKVAADAVRLTDMGTSGGIVVVPDNGGVVPDSGGGSVVTDSVTADNSDAAFSMVGKWKVTDRAVGFYGADYAFAYAGSGSDKATFTFQIPADGDYEITAQWPAHSSRAPDAPFTLVNNGVVVDTIRTDQRVNGGRFNVLAGPTSQSDDTYALAAGVLQVVLTNDASGKVAADAVRVTDMGTSNSVIVVPDNGSGNVVTGSIIADNTDTAFSTVGTWRVSDSAVGFYGADYAYAYAGNGSAAAIFTFDIPSDGNYEIAAQWPAHSSRAPDAPFTLVNNGVVVDIIRMDQRANGGRFNVLAGPTSQSDDTYALAAGVLQVVLTNDASGKVAADAVRIGP